jgi:hypothetical protein
MIENTLPLCPDCSFDHNDNLIDTCYPANRERTIFQVSCGEHNGGCGRTIYGQSMEDAIKRWTDSNNHDEGGLTGFEIETKLNVLSKIKNNLLNFN